MRRAQHPIPYEMRSMKTDSKTGGYLLSEKGITFYLTLEQTRKGFCFCNINH